MEETIIELVNEGYNPKEIASKLKIHTTEVVKIIEQLEESGILKSRDEDEIKELNEFQLKVKKLLDDGYNMKEIAIQLDQKYSRVQYTVHMLKVEGLIDESKRKAEDISCQEEIKKLFEENRSYEEIAKITGKKLSYVRGVIKRLNSKNLIDKAKVKENKLSPKQKEIKRLYEEGYSYKQIEEMTGVDMKNVHSVLSNLHKKRIINEAETKRNRSKLRTKNRFINDFKQHINNKEYEEAIMVLEKLDKNLLSVEQIENIEKMKEMIKKVKEKQNKGIEIER